MTSTVLDVTVLLLCVSASVVALGATGGDVSDHGPTADDVADRLVTETVTVTYESSASPGGTRTVHATRAELLAILVADCGRVDAGSGASGAFSARSRAAIGDGLGPRTRIDVRAVTATEGNDAVTADATGPRTDRSKPRSDAPVTDERGREPIAVGTDPPRDAEVTAAIVTQPAPSEAETVRSVRIVIRRW